MKELSKELKQRIAEEANAGYDTAKERLACIDGATEALTNPSIYSLAGLSPSLEWVEVSESLPETKGKWNESGYVLCIGSGFSEPVSCWYSKESGWHYAHYLLNGTPEVTHWMPSPPKQQ